MSKKWAGGKAGDPGGRRLFVPPIYQDEFESMAFKTLSPVAVWLLIHFRWAWWTSKNKNAFALPFSRVSWKLTFKAFDKARRELVDAGFIQLVDPGGLSPGGLNPTLYALSERWREASKNLMDDLEALYEIKVPLKAGGFMSVWYPARPLSESQENAARARAGKAEKRASIEARKKAKRTLKMKSKRIPKSPDRELGRAAVSVRRRLQNSITLLEREGHG